MKALFEAMVGDKNSDYYLNQFESLEDESEKYKVSWNWAAFFAGPLWVLYRKMYVWFFVVLSLNYVLGLVTEDATLNFSIFIMIIQNMVFALYANALYRNNLYLKISNAIKVNETDSDLLNSLKQQGGVNMWVAEFFKVVVR